MQSIKESDVNFLMQRFGVFDTVTVKSIILNRIEELSGGSYGKSGHTSHSSHCQFGRAGGGHGNVCYNTNEGLVNPDNPEKNPGLSR